MGNIISSFFSGFVKVIGSLFGSQLDFLAGKSCNSVCGSTWDFICYIENFCVANLLKMAMVLVLCYIVLLCFYMLYKLGICWCIGHSLCKILWACLVSWFSFWEYCCTFLWVKLLRVKKRTQYRRRNFEDKTDASEEEDYYDDQSFSSDHMPRRSSLSWPGIDYREAHLRKSLRPRSHQAQLVITRRDAIQGLKRNSIEHHNHLSKVQDHVRVTHTTKFVKKGRNITGTFRSRRW